MKLFSFLHTSGTRDARMQTPQAQVAHKGRRTLPKGMGRALLSLFVVLLALFVTGCGNTLYLVKVNRAEQNFQEAQELGAEEHAPYEYYSAKARLAEAKRQAAQAEYGPASDLSEEAYDYSVKAINISKTKRQSGADK